LFYYRIVTRSDVQEGFLDGYVGRDRNSRVDHVLLGADACFLTGFIPQSSGWLVFVRTVYRLHVYAFLLRIRHTLLAFIFALDGHI